MGQASQPEASSSQGVGEAAFLEAREGEKADEGLPKRGRKPGLQGEQPAAERKKQSMGRYGHHHHYGLGAVARSPSPLGAGGSGMACLWIFRQGLLYKRDYTT